MFDLSFYELLVFGIIALIVLGPEKLPQAVRKAGTYYAKFRRTVGTIKAEMEAELDLAETRQKMEEELAKIRQAEADMQREMAQLRGSMKEFEQQTSPLELSPESSSSEDTVSLDKNQANTNTHNDSKTHETLASSDAEVSSHATDTLEPATRPWQNMWFLLSDYDRKNRLPPAPLLPNYKANPLLNAVPLQSTPQQTLADVKNGEVTP